MKRRRDKVYADQEILDLFADEPELVAVVDAVAATQRRRARRGPLAVGAVVTAVAVAALVIVVVAPWHGSPGIVEQALAAVGSEPVVHAIVSSDLPQDERVNLATGSSWSVRVNIESWVDSEGDAVHALIRHDGLDGRRRGELSGRADYSRTDR